MIQLASEPLVCGLAGHAESSADLVPRVADLAGASDVYARVLLDLGGDSTSARKHEQGANVPFIAEVVGVSDPFAADLALDLVNPPLPLVGRRHVSTVVDDTAVCQPKMTVHDESCLAVHIASEACDCGAAKQHYIDGDRDVQIDGSPE